MRLLLFFLLLVGAVQAQIESEVVSYTDYNPSYQLIAPANENQMLISKVIYTPAATIIHFWYAIEVYEGSKNGIKLYAPDGVHPWCLIERTTEKELKLKAIEQIYLDGKLAYRVLKSTTKIEQPTKIGRHIVNCEIHLEPVYNQTKEMDLLEGKDQRYTRGHFNVLALQIKKKSDKALGTAVDEQKRITAFLTKYKNTIYEGYGLEEEEQVIFNTPRFPNGAKTSYLYTDTLPEFRAFETSYGIDKIEYTNSNTIFHCRVMIQSSRVTFYAKGNVYDYLLKDRQHPSNQFEMQSIKNIHQNGALLKKDLKKELVVKTDDAVKNVFTYEVHFERLPKNIKAVDLIEGAGQEYNRNHFNYFDITIKNPITGELGDSTAYRKRGRAKNKSKTLMYVDGTPIKMPTEKERRTAKRKEARRAARAKRKEGTKGL